MQYAAKHGHADAQFELGLMNYEIYTQVGNPGDIAAALPEAMKWLRKAADQGHAEAQFLYGWIHYDMDQDVDAYMTNELGVALTWFAVSSVKHKSVFMRSLDRITPIFVHYAAHVE